VGGDEVDGDEVGVPPKNCKKTKKNIKILKFIGFKNFGFNEFLNI
jgi:hypothetical protein